MKQISTRDIRALKFGLAGIAAVIALLLGLTWLDHWVEVKRLIAEDKIKFEQAGRFPDTYKSFAATVPVIEVPKKEQEQQYAFRDEFNKQLSRCGIRAKPLKFVTASKSPSGQYKLLCLECSGKANIEQIFNLLADLKNNPYLAAIEEFSIKKTDLKNESSREFDLNMKLSTFVRK
jgi:hypothetical protein